MAKTRFIWIILVILALIFIVPNLMKKESINFGIIGYPSLEQCNVAKNIFTQQGLPCIGECVSKATALNCGIDIYTNTHTLFLDYSERNQLYVAKSPFSSENLGFQFSNFSVWSISATQ